jgi:hypothetical protein
VSHSKSQMTSAAAFRMQCDGTAVFEAQRNAVSLSPQRLDADDLKAMLAQIDARGVDNRSEERRHDLLHETLLKEVEEEEAEEARALAAAGAGAGATAAQA